MNVLIFFLSMITRSNPDEIPYKGPDGKDYMGVQTNEAATKYLLAKLYCEGAKLGKIIAITTREAENNGVERFIKGIEDFIKGIEEFCYKNFGKKYADSEADDLKFDIRNITFIQTYEKDKPEKEREYEDVLAEVLEKIKPDDKVYIDTSGGKRPDVNKMLLLMKLVQQYKGIKIENAFYSDFGEKTTKIENSFYRQLDILYGVNQFVTTGNAMQLKNCYSSNKDDSNIKELLNAMVEFSDSVNLCNLSGIKNTLSNMQDSLVKLKDSNKGGMEMFLFGRIIPIIEEKFFGNSDSPDYSQIILWCLDNRLVQQAVTLYVEKIPKYLFVDKKLITADDKVKSETKCHNPEEDLEKDIFFYKLMACVELPPPPKEEVVMLEELNHWLDDRKNRANDPNVVQAILAICGFNDFRWDKKCHNYCHSYKEAAELFLSSAESENGMKKIAQEILKSPCMCQKSDYYDFLKRNKTLQRDLLNLPRLKKPNFTEININTIKYYTDKDKPDGIEVFISSDELRRVMLDYLFAKRIRNHINHASDFNDTMKVFEELYNDKKKIDDKPNMNDIITLRLRKAIEFIQHLNPQKSD